MMKIYHYSSLTPLPPEEKGYWSTRWRQNTSCAGQKPRADWRNDLQIRGAGRKSRKLPTPVVGMKPYGKCQLMTRLIALRVGAALTTGLLTAFLIRICAVYKVGELIAFLFGWIWAIVVMVLYIHLEKIVRRNKGDA
jgi:hypothetical protein